MTISSDQNNDWRPWVMPAMTRKPTQPTIKSDVNPSSPSRPTAETLRRALEEIQQARTRAREKGHAKGLAQGKEQGQREGFEQGKTQGYQEGFQKGYQEGLEQAHAELRQQQQQQIAHFESLFTQASDELQRLDEVMGESLVSLCCTIAAHILQREIQARNYDLFPLIQQSLRHLLDEQPVQIHIHPDDYAALADHPEWRAHWQLQPDPELTPCSVKIYAPWGAVDAQLSTRWQEIIKALLPESALNETALSSKLWRRWTSHEH
ncbi:MAG TPA: flagellar assembly protein FliH [Paenalcaligenes sp.]|nr:flagellar assembly protein FliH [Paenalcaligenes sp.]